MLFFVFALIVTAGPVRIAIHGFAEDPHEHRNGDNHYDR